MITEASQMAAPGIPNALNQRSISLASLTGGLRNLKSKRDIKQLQFDREQVMIYNKIRGAKSSLDNYNHREAHVPKEEVRKLKPMQLTEGK